MIPHVSPVAVPVRRSRPRWMMPALVALLIAVGLGLAGVVSWSSLLSVAFFGGMIGMHLFGHGGHGGHEAHGGDSTENAAAATDEQPRSGGCH